MDGLSCKAVIGVSIIISRVLKHHGSLGHKKSMKVIAGDMILLDAATLCGDGDAGLSVAFTSVARQAAVLGSGCDNNAGVTIITCDAIRYHGALTPTVYAGAIGVKAADGVAYNGGAVYPDTRLAVGQDLASINDCLAELQRGAGCGKEQSAEAVCHGAVDKLTIGHADGCSVDISHHYVLDNGRVHGQLNAVLFEVGDDAVLHHDIVIGSPAHDPGDLWHKRTAEGKAIKIDGHVVRLDDNGGGGGG